MQFADCDELYELRELAELGELLSERLDKLEPTDDGGEAARS